MNEIKEFSIIGDNPTITTEQIEQIEQIDIRLDNGNEEPDSRVNAVFMPSALVSMVGEFMGPLYSSPSEYIVEQLRQHIFWGRK